MYDVILLINWSNVFLPFEGQRDFSQVLRSSIQAPSKTSTDRYAYECPGMDNNFFEKIIKADVYFLRK